MEIDIPIFDFHSPVLALIQLALFFLNPQLTGQFTDKLTNPRTKIIVLGSLSLVGVVLTKLLDYAVSNTWAQFDFAALVNVVFAFLLSWGISQLAYEKVLRPTGASAAAQESNVLKFIGPDPDLVAAEKKTSTRTTKKAA